ncbi:unnamed protein product [Diabrotica balteata]|uniref:Uncharacterized protein n=1 Tax=Diabrotica balteata TaxID=107213 RepID=A0A9N9T5Z2_DIABA|nr:unnamed protein product [Diabrotica balteata]
MAKAFDDFKMAEKFESMPLLHQTIQRRIVAMGEQVEKSMLSLVKKSSYFLFCLDKSTNQTNVSQLLIFVRTTFDNFTSKEELFVLFMEQKKEKTSLRLRRKQLAELEALINVQP